MPPCTTSRRLDHAERIMRSPRSPDRRSDQQPQQPDPPTVPLRVTARIMRTVSMRARRLRLARGRTVGPTLVRAADQTGSAPLLRRSTVMARKSRIALPGLSRSTKCSIRYCRRLDGHKGEHRTTLTASKMLTAAKLVAESADRYEVPAEAATPRPKVGTPRPKVGTPRPKVGKAKRPARAKAGTQCRISRHDVRCSLRLGHKALGRRHRFGTAVKVVPAAEARRQVAASPKVTKRSRYITSSKPSARLA
jgi:hypothetical protein